METILKDIFQEVSCDIEIAINLLHFYFLNSSKTLAIQEIKM